MRKKSLVKAVSLLAVIACASVAISGPTFQIPRNPQMPLAVAAADCQVITKVKVISVSKPQKKTVKVQGFDSAIKAYFCTVKVTFKAKRIIKDYEKSITPPAGKPAVKSFKILTPALAPGKKTAPGTFVNNMQVGKSYYVCVKNTDKPLEFFMPAGREYCQKIPANKVQRKLLVTSLKSHAKGKMFWGKSENGLQAGICLTQDDIESDSRTATVNFHFVVRNVSDKTVLLPIYTNDQYLKAKIIVNGKTIEQPIRLPRFRSAFSPKMLQRLSPGCSVQLSTQGDMDVSRLRLPLKKGDKAKLMLGYSNSRDAKLGVNPCWKGTAWSGKATINLKK